MMEEGQKIDQKMPKKSDQANQNAKKEAGDKASESVAQFKKVTPQESIEVLLVDRQFQMEQLSPVFINPKVAMPLKTFDFVEPTTSAYDQQPAESESAQQQKSSKSVRFNLEGAEQFSYSIISDGDTTDEGEEIFDWEQNGEETNFIFMNL
jgi:hypothetical protein